MEEIKALFLDIDGTLVSFQTHTVPTSTVEALEEAHRQGVSIFISTGRPMAFITNLKSIEHIIDGYITTNGAYCTVGDTVVSSHPMDPDDINTILTDAIERNYPVIVDGEHSVLVYNNAEIVDRLFVKAFGVDTLDYNLTLDDIQGEAIMQLSPFITQEQEDLLTPRFKHITSGRWHPEFTDLTRSGIDKAMGMRTMAEYMHIDISQTMAFGDGGNDIPILQAAGIGVAMGNSNNNVKEAANYVTTTVDDNGIANALRHFEVIK